MVTSSATQTRGGAPLFPSAGRVRPAGDREPSGFADPPESARLLRMAENTASMGHWSWDCASDHLTWSDQLFQIFGLDPAKDRPTATAVVDACHPNERAEIAAKVSTAIAAQAGFELDCRIVRPDGTVRSVISRGQPAYEGERFIGFFGVITDVTEAFAAIRSIHNQNEMLDLAAELAHLGHWIWSADENALTFCSEELARIHGLTPAAFIEQFKQPALLAETFAPQYRQVYVEVLERALKDAVPYKIEYVVDIGGTAKYLREVGQPIFDEKKKLTRFIAAAQDITESKQREIDLQAAEQELRKKTEELQELNRQKDKLFSIVAHDLKNPFNSVIGFADVLAAKARELSPGKIATYAKIVRESAAGVHELLDNLLAWASYQIRDGAFHRAPFDLGAAIAGGLEPLALMAEAKKVTIVSGIPPVTVIGDESLIRVVVRNLVSNGIKFSRNGGVVHVTAAEIDGARPAMARITVRDNGVGLSAAAAADLFELDRTVSSLGTRGEKGTGLGLYLCRDIIARHGGAISVEVGSPAGAAFHFTLPMAP